jgi:hypothetical protein
MAMSFVFDPDADFQILECTPANPANPANPVDGRQASGGKISSFSYFSRYTSELKIRGPR